MQLLLIYNPHSGKGHIRSKISDMIEFYTASGYAVTVRPTQCEKDATNFTKQHGNKYDMIVCCGGDGTLSEIMNGLMKVEKTPVVGYIPSGTVNDFATSLRLSKNILIATKTTVDGKRFACDVGTFNESVFTYIAAFGLFTDVSYQTPQEYKNILGRMAYILEGAKRLGSIKSYAITVKTAEEMVTDEFIYGMITNSISIGGFKGLSGKNVKLDDGEFEVVFARKPKKPAEIHALLQCVLTAKIDPLYFYTCRTSEIEIISEEIIDWTLDGEFGGSVKHAFIKNHKKAIDVMVPREDR